MDHPNRKEQAMLVAARTSMTRARPNRSDREPMEKEARRPIKGKNAAMYAPDPAAFDPTAPAKLRHVAINAGVQDHMPRSSQLWQVYPEINSMAGRFPKTSPVNRCPFRRTATGITVPRRVIQARSQPTIGPTQVRRNESL
jgi:hypothetical protein